MNEVFPMIKQLALKIDRVFHISAFQKEYLRWLQDEGDAKLRLNYNLNESSEVWDLGGYVGDFAAEVYCRFSCKVLTFEPIDKFAKKCQDRFIKNEKVKIFNFGLGSKDEEMDIGLSADATSVFKSDSVVKCQFKDIHQFYVQQGSPSIDLMKINIEGGEYEVLNRAIETGMIKNIKNLQVQFHDFVPDAEKQYSDLEKKLSLTHKKTWSYKFIWENWTLK